jgi:hypothetical protein
MGYLKVISSQTLSIFDDKFPKMDPRTKKQFQDRRRDIPTKGLLCLLFYIFVCGVFVRPVFIAEGGSWKILKMCSLGAMFILCTRRLDVIRKEA